MGNGHDGQKEVGKASDSIATNGSGQAPAENRDENYEGGGNKARHGGDGFVNGNGEWEAKWPKGTQQKQMDFARGLDIKIESVENDVRDD